MKKLNLKKLREVGDKATEGRWTCDGDIIQKGSIHIAQVDLMEQLGKSLEDRAFIIEARNNWEAMIEALEEANKILNIFTSTEGCLGNKARRYMKRFEDEE